MENSKNNAAVKPTNGVHVNDTLQSVDIHARIEESLMGEPEPVKDETPAPEVAKAERVVPMYNLTQKAVSMNSPTDVSWMKRRMENAYKGYLLVDKELGECSTTLRNKSVKDDEKEKTRKMTPEQLDEYKASLVGQKPKMRKMTAAEIVSYQTKKRELTVTKQETKDEYLQLKRDYNNASRHNLNLRKVGLNENREEAKLLSAITDMVKQALTSLYELANDGPSENLVDLRFLAAQAKRADFRKKVSATLIDLNKERWEDVLRYKKVESELGGHIYDEFRRSKSNKGK
ncbi:MAG: hypothetical protein WCQ44_09135 [Opitutaceae bacterium]